MLEKQALRRQVKTLIKALSTQERLQASRAVMARLEKEEHVLQARTIVLFSSLPDEISTREMLERYAASKTVLLPVVNGDDLLLCPFQGFSQMKKGAYSISEPLDSSHPLTDLSSIDLVIVPGVAFDAQGHRLGRGKGYYDRLLSRTDLHRAYKIGICFACQMVEAIPTEKHDMMMDKVISSTPIY